MRFAIALPLSVSTAGLPSAGPGTATVGVNQSGAIAGVSLAESGATATETFSVTLTDNNGDLTATGAGTINGAGTTSLSISGTLAQVNTDLGTLTDKDGTLPSDTITINASDSFGNTAGSQSIAVTVNSVPVISAPGTATVTQSSTTAISGVSVNESGNTTSSGETFTVTLTDAHGDLSATGAGVSGAGTTSPTITGSLTQVDSDLGTLTDNDGTTPSDTITINATDSFGNKAAPATIAVTVQPHLVPVITAPATATVGVNQPGAISGVSLAETNNTGGETFTVTATDTHGLLSATGAGVSGAGTTALTITGSMAQVNTDLSSLKDTDATTPSDTITFNASDSFGNTAVQQTTAVTVNGLPVITAPASATVTLATATAISGVSVAETGNTSSSGESFTVTLADTNGDLSATGAGVSGAGTTSLPPSGG